MRAELLEQAQHLLVTPPGSPGQVMHDNVFEMEVPHLDLVGVAMGDDEGLGDGPGADSWNGEQRLSSRVGPQLVETVDPIGSSSHPSQQIGPSLLEV
jgi:hypothetical protein